MQFSSLNAVTGRGKPDMINFQTLEKQSYTFLTPTAKIFLTCNFKVIIT